jgi:hypothetical protein
MAKTCSSKRSSKQPFARNPAEPGTAPMPKPSVKMPAGHLGLNPQLSRSYSTMCRDTRFRRRFGECLSIGKQSVRLIHDGGFDQSFPRNEPYLNNYVFSMEINPEPCVVAAEKLGKGVVSTLDDGKSALCSAALLRASLPHAEGLEQNRVAEGI